MKVSKANALAAIACGALIACSTVADSPEVESGVVADAAVEESLYERLGGYEAISAVANDFAQKLFIDPRVGPFFKGMGTDTRKSFIQKNINLICNVTGGPCKVISRDARTSRAEIYGDPPSAIKLG